MSRKRPKTSGSEIFSKPARELPATGFRLQGLDFVTAFSFSSSSCSLEVHQKIEDEEEEENEDEPEFQRQAWGRPVNAAEHAKNCLKNRNGYVVGGNAFGLAWQPN